METEILVLGIKLDIERLSRIIAALSPRLIYEFRASSLQGTPTANPRLGGSFSIK